MSPEQNKELSGLLHDKAMTVLIHDGMDFLEHTLAPASEALDKFKEKIVSVNSESQQALIDLRELYLNKNTLFASDEVTSKTKEFIENFLRLYHIGDKNTANFNAVKSPSHVLYERRRTQPSFGFFPNNENKIENTANKLNDLGKAHYQKKEYRQAAEYFKLAADKGYNKAWVNLGICYHLGKGVRADDEMAIHCLEAAAKAKDPKALYQLGLACHEGWYDGEVNQNKARDYFIESAVLNYGDALSQLGWYAENGLGGFKQDLHEGYKYYIKAEQSGSTQGCYHAGRCYEQGKGVSENLTMALTYYRRAEQKGHEEAKDAIIRIEPRIQPQNKQDALDADDFRLGT